MSDESTIFNRLEHLARRPGYAHVIAALCYRLKFLSSNSPIALADGSTAGRGEKIIRTEIGLLVGLFSKSERDLSIPTIEMFREMINQTELLLSKLHEAQMNVVVKGMCSTDSETEDAGHDSKVAFLREAMIYSGESAYTFQYRNMAPAKYKADDPWIIDKRGFSMNDACAVYDSILETHKRRIKEIIEESKPHHLNHHNLLKAYVFSESQLTALSRLDRKTIRAVISSFSLKSFNENFTGISEFNEANANPLIPVGDSEYVLFDVHALSESLYESPFYWMVADRGYCNIHTEHRGKFTESFCAERLRAVFGKDRVYTNIKIPKNKGRTYTEIDVLVCFADRVVLVQAKSKRLTIDARRGNITAIERDFRHGIQQSCDQAYDGASLLFDKSIRESLSKRFGVRLPRSIKEVFLLSTLSDHYPGLSIQVRQFLSRHDDPIIRTPLVIDIFALDVITEFLNSPLYFLSYLKRRSQYCERIIAAQELTIFAHHLSSNLWLDSDVDIMSIEDGCCEELDLAVVGRRCFGDVGVVPDGILTIFRDTFSGRFLREICSLDDAVIFELGLRLLEMSSNALREFDEGCVEVMRRTEEDGLNHDISTLFSKGKFGITVHCNFQPHSIAHGRLLDHCHRRKYERRSECWFGLCLYPMVPTPRFGVKVEGPWESSPEMAEKIRSLGRPRKRVSSFVGVRQTRPKIGRNDPCPCGSGRKYKKCCL